ncbi:hypothetical protein ACWERY_13820 [Streptomyces sp. NPDC004082]
MRWELRHRCWAGCAGHTAFDEYGDDRDHRYASSGSAAFSADGKLLWAHVLGPLSGEQPDGDRGEEEWLVLDAADGTVLARTRTRTSAAGSVHVPHPDPGQMGLSVGEGQDWLVDATRMRLTGRIGYPFEVSGLPRGLGNGTWYTVSEDENALHVWAL